MKKINKSKNKKDAGDNTLFFRRPLKYRAMIYIFVVSTLGLLNSSMAEGRQMPKHREEDPFKKIIHEWKLTSDLENDFATSTMKTYMRKNPHAEFDEHVMIDILRIAIGRIVTGLEEIKKEDKVECLFETMENYVNYDIEKEEEYQRKIKELGADLEKLHKKKKKSLNKKGGEK